MISYDISLLNYNSFGINQKAKQFFSFEDQTALQNFIYDHPELTSSGIVLGGGSNILLTEPLESLVIHPENEAVSIIEESESDAVLCIGAGVNWDDLVKFSLERNLYGLENLSMIPGNCGAAPIQNIGAYGVELREVFEKLEAADLTDGSITQFSHADCEFGYRDSIFKREAKGRYCIIRIYLRLHKTPKLSLEYGSIRRTLEDMNVTEPTPADVSRAVRYIRGSKLPDPQKTGNAGSFFKNPIISNSFYNSLKEKWPDLPNYPVSETSIKVPAGWLIDHAGWKGYRHKNAGVHDRQALVLVNLGDKTGKDVRELAAMIRDYIFHKYGIELEPEVNIWNRHGQHIGLPSLPHS